MLFASLAACASDAAWNDIVAKARGQVVEFNAWAGDEKINAFIAWVGDEVARRYGVTLRHVKLRDTAEAVTRVIAEKSAGRNSDGSVDLIWLNGPNFLALKEQRLLYGPFATGLPNYRYVDVKHDHRAHDARPHPAVRRETDRNAARELRAALGG